MERAEIDPGESIDQRVRLHGASWSDYERLLALRGESAVPRITFFEGELELMSPSHRHETVGKMIGRLVEAFAEERGICLNGAKSWTIKRRKEGSGLEPDECYLLGVEPRSRPDLAIEVVLSSGGLQKLEAYRRLGVPEVWFWRKGRIEVHVLRKSRFVRVVQSALLPGIDLEAIARLSESADQTAAVREYRRSLQGRG